MTYVKTLADNHRGLRPLARLAEPDRAHSYLLRKVVPQNSKRSLDPGRGTRSRKLRTADIEKIETTRSLCLRRSPRAFVLEAKGNGDPMKTKKFAIRVVLSALVAASAGLGMATRNAEACGGSVVTENDQALEAARESFGPLVDVVRAEHIKMDEAKQHAVVTVSFPRKHAEAGGKVERVMLPLGVTKGKDEVWHVDGSTLAGLSYRVQGCCSPGPTMESRVEEAVRNSVGALRNDIAVAPAVYDRTKGEWSAVVTFYRWGKDFKTVQETKRILRILGDASKWTVTS
jgi:hypothetical protein